MSSLADDFAMYYSGTYIGYRQSNGKIDPFYVESVSTDRELFDLSSIPRADRDRMAHGEEAHNALVFNGTLQPVGGRNRQMSVNINRDQLVFDLPDPRYVKLDNRYYWVSYRPNRSTKKGLCSRRISCRASFSHHMVDAMFGPSDDNIIGGCFLRQGNNLDYKGVAVGNMEGNNITLVAEAAHLTRVLQREVPNCQITVAPAVVA